MRKVADLTKLDKKHLSPETLGMLISGETPQLQQVLDRPDLKFLLAQAKERQRQLFDAIKYPDFYRKPPAERPTAEPNMSPFSPIAPGSPTAPGSPVAPGAPGGIVASAALKTYIMAKAANGEEMGESEEHVEGQIEAPEEEAEESLPPEIMERIVNFIVSQGQGIDDEAFHKEVESVGVEPHEAEEEVYRLLAQLIGGKNDIIPGGRAAGMPNSQFPPEQLSAGREVEMEHTPNPAIANEISKDHLVEGDDYYEPRLDDLEKKMESDKDEGKVEGVGQGTAKAEKNDAAVRQDVEKLKKSAFKHGFFLKLAERGLKPTEFEELFRLSFNKAAAGASGAASVASTLTGGALLGKVLDALGGAAKGIGSMAVGAGKLGLVAPLLMAPILGGIAGGSAYYMTRPDEMSADDVKHMERLALYKRLSRRARSRTRKEEPEAEAEKTRGDDAHRKILPMPSTPGVEV